MKNDDKKKRELENLLKTVPLTDNERMRHCNSVEEFRRKYPEKFREIMEKRRKQK